MQLHGGNELIDALKLLQRAQIKQGEVVADLGCGAAGHFVFPAAHLVGPQGKVYAVDILPSVLQAIESRGKLEGLTNIETVWSDLDYPQALKIPEHSLDLCLFLNILFQLQKRTAGFEQAARLTKSQGRLLIVDWKLSAAPLGPPAARRVAPEELTRLAQGAGFVLQGMAFAAGPYHYGLLFVKNP